MLGCSMTMKDQFSPDSNRDPSGAQDAAKLLHRRRANSFPGLNSSPSAYAVRCGTPVGKIKRSACRQFSPGFLFPPTPASEPETSCSHRRLVSHDRTGRPRSQVPLRTATARPTGLGYAHRPLRYPIRRRESRIIPQGTQPGKSPQELLAAQPSK